MQAIEAGVESLNNPTITEDEKLDNYLVVRGTLVTLYDKKVTIDDDDTIDSLVKCANSDVTSNNPRIQEAVLLALDSLFKCKFKRFPIDDIPESYIVIAFEDAAAGQEDLQKTASDCIQSCLRELIILNKLDPEKLLMKPISASSRMRISKLMRTTCLEVPIEKALIFFYEGMIPQMFNTCSVDVRSSLVEDVFELLPHFPLSVLSNDTLGIFKRNVKTRYVERVTELRVLKDPNWHRLWIFLSQSCGKILHVQVAIMNSLLKAVESAFRSTTIEDRLAAYDCWKELIDNYSLDLERMCNPKQMKLVVTPLKTNVSKNDLVTYKRFEIWAHLINVLKERAFACLESFLVFCFGPLGENPCIAGENPDIRSPGRKVSRLWQETTRALLEIIGHYGHDAKHACMDCKDCSLIRLEQPLINSKNFASLDYKIINSVGECSLLMLQWMEKPAIEKVIRCLWGSLLNIIKQLKGKEQEMAIERLTLQLVVYIQNINEKPEYFNYILKPVLDLVLLGRFFPIEIYNKMFLFPLLKCFLKYSDLSCTSGSDIIVGLFSCGKNTNFKSSWFKQAYNVFEKVEVRENLSTLSKLWIECADVLIHLCWNERTEQVADVVQNTGVPFMMWPILYMQRIPSKQIMNELVEKWGITFEGMYNSYTKEALFILVNLRTSIIEAPMTVSNVAMIFQSFHPLLRADPSDKFIADLVHLASDSLALLNLTKNEADSFVPVIITLMDVISRKTNGAAKDAMLQNLLHCCKCLLQPYEKFKIFDPLEKLFNKTPPTFKESVPECLLTVIADYQTHSDATVAAKATKLFNKLAPPTKAPPKPSKATLLPPSRAAKISFMARSSLPKEAENSKDSTIRLFGQTLASPSMSPTSVRGSQMANAGRSKPRKRKAANAFASSNKQPVIDDGDEANYVFVDTKYEFNRDKLSDHQMEVLKKRRSDIPALYQDLSQSQSSSQDLFQSGKQNDLENSAKVRKQEPSDSQQNAFNCDEHSYIKPLENDKNCSNNTSNLSISSSTTKNIKNDSTKAHKPKKNIHIIDDITIFPAANTIVATSTKDTLSATSVCTQKTNFYAHTQPVRDSEGKENTDIDHSTQDKLSFSTATKSPVNTPKNKLDEVKEAAYEQDVNTVNNQINMAISDEKRSSIDDNFNLKANLQAQNPSKEECETTTVNDSSSAHGNVSINSEKRSENEEPGSPVEKDLKRLSRVQKELNKIKMDIVGGDAFVQNLDLASNGKMQTRGRADVSTSHRGLRRRSLSKAGNDSDSNRRFGLKDRRTTLSPRNGKQSGELSPASPAKSKLNNGDVKSPTRCKLVDRFKDMQNEDLGSNEIISKRGRRRKLDESNCSPEKHKEKAVDVSDKKRWNVEKPKEKTVEVSDKKKSVRKRLNDVLETPSTKIVEEIQSKVKEKEIKLKVANNELPKERKTDANTQEKTNKNSKRTRKNKNEDIVAEKNLPKNSENGVVLQNSEDVIESSQESFVDINPHQNYSKLDDSTMNKKKTEAAEAHTTDLSQLNSEIKQIVTRISQRKIQKPKDTNSRYSFSPTPASPPKESWDSNDSEVTKIESESKEYIENVIGVCSPDELMRIDLTTRIADLSSGKKDTCEMDTQTQEIIAPAKEITPKKTVSAIPTSPVGVDTPTRTYELINNTLNISPIKQDNRSNSQRTQDLFDSESSTPKTDLQPAGNVENAENKSIDQNKSEVISAIKTLPSITNPSTRSEKLLNLVSCTPTLKRTKLLLTKMKRIRPNILTAPKGHRTMQMMQKCEQTLEAQEAAPNENKMEVVQIEDSDEEGKGCIPEKDLLQFVRELPGPTASPKYSILKRRRTPEMNDEGLSPPRKQKRVNFSDPPLTCQKVFIQDENEHVRFAPAKKIKEVEPLPSHLRVNFPSFDIASNSDEVHMDQSDPQEVQSSVPPEASGSEADVESPSVQTQGSVDVTEAHLLDRDQPIYSELVDCSEDIQNILPSLTSQMYVPTLLEECHNKRLYTVGDLAKLSEIEINRLPVKIPKVAGVRLALAKFHKSQKLRNEHVGSANVESATAELGKGDASVNQKLQESMTQLPQSSQAKVSEICNTEQEKSEAELNHNHQNSSPSIIVASNGTDLKWSQSVSFQIALKPSQNGTKPQELKEMPRRKLMRKIPLTRGSGLPSMFRNYKVMNVPKVTPSPMIPIKDNSQKLMEEERKKLEEVMTDLITDFTNLQNKAVQQNLKLSSLYGTILEIAGPTVFVSLLQENDLLKLTHFVKNNNWSRLFRDILDSIGIKKFMFWLTRVPRVSPLNIVDGIFEQLATQDANINIKEVAIHIMETVPLTLILQQFGMERIVTEIHQLCQNSHFSADELFKLMMFKFSPNIVNISPTFRNINIVRLEGMTVERTNSFEKDLSSFIERILTTFEKSRLPSVFPKDKMLTFYDSKELTTGILECSSNDEILESCETLLQKLPKANLKENTYKSLAQRLFTKIPFADLWQYFSDHVNSCPDMMPHNNN